MVDRIKQILDKLGVPQGRFADEIGISPAVLSHVLKGRNRPSLELVMSILHKYPSISTDWLLLGKGEMMRPRERSANPAEQRTVEPRIVTELKEVPKPVERITVRYTDGTYCDFFTESHMEGKSLRTTRKRK